MTTISKGTQVHETETGKTWVRWEAGMGFFMLTQEWKSSAPQRLPIDPAAIDALVAMWPEWRKSLPSDAFAPNAASGTRSPPQSRDGQAQNNSRSSAPEPFVPSPRSTTSGSGAPSSPTAREPPAVSKPAAPRDLFG
jgi:hypothetical protein